jgi:hypothetical protein
MAKNVMKISLDCPFKVGGYLLEQTSQVRRKHQLTSFRGKNKKEDMKREFKDKETKKTNIQNIYV